MTNNANDDTIFFEMHGNEATAEQYKCFASFSHHSFTLDGKEWGSVNHYFQANKFEDEEMIERIRAAPTSFQASHVGKNRSYPIKKNWDDMREDVMLKATLAKFQQNSDVKDVLLGTGDKHILCVNHEDGFWGDGVGCNGRHLNKMGSVLERVRATLR
jgi:ribA/ribD-fused uncharacterized protein